MARAVRDAYLALPGSADTDLWLMLGDNAYNDGTDAEYQAAVFDMYPSLLRRVAVWPTFGNHEAHTSSSTAQTGPYYDIFTLPRLGRGRRRRLGDRGLLLLRLGQRPLRLPRLPGTRPLRPAARC